MFKNGVRYALKDYWKELELILASTKYLVNYSKSFGSSICNTDLNKIIIYCEYFKFLYDTRFGDDLVQLLLFTTKTSKDEAGKILIYDKSIVNMFKENESLSGNKTKVCKKSTRKTVKKVKRL